LKDGEKTVESPAVRSVQFASLRLAGKAIRGGRDVNL
jgi:hypothetical protein